MCKIDQNDINEKSQLCLAKCLWYPRTRVIVNRELMS